MRKDDRITPEQVKDYKRRIDRSDFLKFHVELLCEDANKITHIRKLLQSKYQEIKLLEITVGIQSNKISKIDKFIIDEFGIKSVEYEKYKKIS